ncbi:MAG: VOC family protein [Candidatus Pacebacteria bacterium]|nr:VOC family protein [Candidatus Paceibacterota bacterium]
MSKKASHFCIGVADMEKAVSFYRDIIGLKVLYKTSEWSELELSKDMSLALRVRKKEEAINYSSIGFSVDDCEKETKEIEGKGVEMVIRCHQRKANTADDSQVILSQFKDMDGNIIWLSQQI